MQTLRFYTDGGCSGNPGPGGWAYICLDKNNDIILSDFNFEENTTNNRMELTAIVEVFKYINNNKINNIKYEIISDSSYAINCITLWSKTWQQNNWMRSGNKQIENLSIIQELYNYYIIKNLKSQVKFTKIKGHSGILGNELCDSIVSKNKAKYNSLIKKYNINDDILIFKKL